MVVVKGPESLVINNNVELLLFTLELTQVIFNCVCVRQSSKILFVVEYSGAALVLVRQIIFSQRCVVIDLSVS